ncbi:hypothetical protein NUW54_g14131 [Trametes sanguinea]|uniref:Uncharacterized protein n=1 Tax=Trametes sanguinea TaxID=158606 RepID=A0ACC1MEE0_9APHY|nr:hypothetical protein NUW54_g14131 [Trametes sanguinea]
MRVLPPSASFTDQRPLLRDGPYDLFPANSTVGPSSRVPVLLPPFHSYTSTRTFPSFTLSCSAFANLLARERVRWYCFWMTWMSIQPSAIPDVHGGGHGGYAGIRSRSLSNQLTSCCIYIYIPRLGKAYNTSADPFPKHSRHLDRDAPRTGFSSPAK